MMRINTNKRYEPNFWEFSFQPIRQRSSFKFSAKMLLNERARNLLSISLNEHEIETEYVFKKIMKQISKGNSLGRISKILRRVKRFEYIERIDL